MAEEDRVREVNDRFYQAITATDIDAMDDIWMDDALSVCVHPGREAVFGYPAIRESWTVIFSNDNSMSIACGNERVAIAGDIAWVSCGETITVTTPEGLGAAAAQATNVFRRVDGKWRMVLHHASGVPFTMQDDWPDVVN
jgi:uncharacterized protein (TIGR02246 family)